MPAPGGAMTIVTWERQTERQGRMIAPDLYPQMPSRNSLREGGEKSPPIR